ncbi:MAG: DNA-processing protein DprA [Acidimicrobiales bacterium]|nr:DNA-processing protein DprA [Acidimicrobiales bacterium]
MSDVLAMAGLLGLPGMGPRRLQVLLDAFGDPPSTLVAVQRGRAGQVAVPVAAKHRDDVLQGWQAAAAGLTIDEIRDRHRRAGVEILHPEHPRWPLQFVDDPEPPPLLFVAGDAALLATPSVAIVGTRRCTAAGVATARDLGRDLADAGIGVVSGLALGIDGAAHEGSLAGDGPTIGVVATGLDVVYPRRHRDLWAEVRSRGVLASEAPLGTAGEKWRFPARNRLIAALAELVVVVESPEQGGSMHTVESAAARGVEVLAVPGPVRSPVSAGPNQLIAEGCGLVRDVDDVLVALGRGGTSSGPRREPAAIPADPVARAVSWPAASLDDIVAATGLPFGEVAARLAILELDGEVERVAEGFQRVSR